MVIVLFTCRREIAAFPAEVRNDLADAVARLDAGMRLSMPLSRPMPILGSGIHELRLKDRSGGYRVVYAMVGTGDVCLVHAFKKAGRTTARRNLDTARGRLKEIRA